MPLPDRAPRMFTGWDENGAPTEGAKLPITCDLIAPDGSVFPAVFRWWEISVITVADSLANSKFHIETRRFAYLRYRRDGDRPQDTTWLDQCAYSEADLVDCIGKNNMRNCRKWRFVVRDGAKIPPPPALIEPIYGDNLETKRTQLIEELRAKGLVEPAEYWQRAERKAARDKAPAK